MKAGTTVFALPAPHIHDSRDLLARAVKSNWPTAYISYLSLGQFGWGASCWDAASFRHSLNRSNLGFASADPARRPPSQRSLYRSCGSKLTCLLVGAD